MKSTPFKFQNRFISSVLIDPPMEFKTIESAPNDILNTNDLFRNKKVLLIGIVGAFTGVCDNQLPPYAEKLSEFKKKGINDIVVVSVNDHHVMKAFAKQYHLDKKLTMIADHDASFTKKLEMDVDFSAAKLGTRSTRYAMLVENGEIRKQWVEESPGKLQVSSAENVLKALNINNQQPKENEQQKN